MKEITSLKDYISEFRSVICDLWGVVHNGRTIYPEATLSLQSMRRIGLFIVLLSNSPRLSSAVIEQLKDLGLPDGCYDAIITSGDLVQDFMETKMKDACFFHLGPVRDRLMVESLSNSETWDVNESDVILCTGYFERQGFQFKIYENLLRSQVTRKIPLICANPDRAVNIGSKQVLCAGTLAGHYEDLGGKVVWLGKPERIAYEKCFATVEKMTGNKFQPSDFLAIGDNLETDIKGAKKLGIKTIFVAEGLHGHFGAHRTKLKALFKKRKIMPDAWMKKLEWN